MRIFTKNLLLLLMTALILTACFGFEDDPEFYDDESFFEEDEFDDEDVFDDENVDEEDDQDFTNAEDEPVTDEPIANAANNSSEFEIPSLIVQPNPGTIHPAYDVFEKYTNVFGVHIFASDTVPHAKVRHAASVMAQYLDNDENGRPDDPAVVQAMVARQATLIMFNEEGERAEDAFFDEADALFDAGIAVQNLYGWETLPQGSSAAGFDATLEEVLHLITHAGYNHAHPELWGEMPGTAVANAMDLARGGYFQIVPNRYPDDAWYTYDDRTCDYECMIAEYIYWALTSILGGQDFPDRLAEIEHEWRPNTTAKVQATDPTIYSLLTDPANLMPTVLPDGSYQPSN